MDLAFHDSRFTAEISKRMQVIIYEILKYSRMNNQITSLISYKV